MSDQCPLCARRKEAPSDLCAFHSAAFRNLEMAYSAWTKAYGSLLTRDVYYSRLLERAETGQAIKDLINHIRSNEAGK